MKLSVLHSCLLLWVQGVPAVQCCAPDAAGGGHRPGLWWLGWGSLERPPGCQASAGVLVPPGCLVHSSCLLNVSFIIAMCGILNLFSWPKGGNGVLSSCTPSTFCRGRQAHEDRLELIDKWAGTWGVCHVGLVRERKTSEGSCHAQGLRAREWSKPDHPCPTDPHAQGQQVGAQG